MNALSQAKGKSQRTVDNLFSVLQYMRTNTYGQMILKEKYLFGFFHKGASYVLQKQGINSLRLFGFIGYVTYSVEFGSLRRHKILTAIAEANANAKEIHMPIRFHITQRQMICTVYDGSLQRKVENASLAEVLAFIAEAIINANSLTEEIIKHAISIRNLRSI